MKKIFLFLAFLITNVLSYGQSYDIVGKWTTIDDETGKAKSIVEIFKKPDGKYYGKIAQLLMKPEHENCVNCKDDRKNKPLLGMEIIRGLKKDGSEFLGGTVTDPKSGKSYKCLITRNGDVLEVRGYVGISLMGRSQSWKLAK